LFRSLPSVKESDDSVHLTNRGASAILDTSKFVRIAVDWLLRSDIGEVIKTIVHEQEQFPDYQIPKKAAGGKKRRPKKHG